MTKRYDEVVEVRVERDARMPSRVQVARTPLRGRRRDRTWRIEGRWWADGRDREYWRVEARGGAVWDLYSTGCATVGTWSGYGIESGS